MDLGEDDGNPLGDDQGLHGRCSDSSGSKVRARPCSVAAIGPSQLNLLLKIVNAFVFVMTSFVKRVAEAAIEEFIRRYVNMFLAGLAQVR